MSDLSKTIGKEPDWEAMFRRKLKQVASLQARIDTLEATFRHIHSSVGKEKGDSSCAECGLDLRDRIHQRGGVK